jgi:hypothetical protein
MSELMNKKEYGETPVKMSKMSELNLQFSELNSMLSCEIGKFSESLYNLNGLNSLEIPVKNDGIPSAGPQNQIDKMHLSINYLETLIKEFTELNNVLNSTVRN